MVNQREYGMDSLGNSVGFQGMNFGRTLVVLFHILPLAFGLGVEYVV